MADSSSPDNKAFIERLVSSLPPAPDNPDHAVRIITLDGQKLVVKYQRQESGRYWREWLSAFACLALFGVKVAPRKLRPGGLQFEAQRMQQLAGLGFDVPEVLLVRLDCLVMRHTGTDINRLLYTDTIAKADYPTLFKRLFTDLGHLHAAGQWHGGAQARNITRCGNRLYRIDFEENTGNAVPLSLAQAYDLVLLFSSVADYLLDNKKLADELLQQYLAIADNTKLRYRLGQILRWLNRLLKVEPFLSKNLRQKSDVRRIKLLAATFNRGLQIR